MFGSGCLLTQHSLTKIIWKYFVKFILANKIGQYTTTNH